ncbi:MAG: PASTA domain-containing protein [Bacteroidota bacterium]
MSFLRPNTLKDLFAHFAVIIMIIVFAVIFIFYTWLPVSTNHGETITVPNVIGLTLEELDDFLGKRNLRFEVTEDSSYSVNAVPLEILRQVPEPNTKVKENRKIYVTINAKNPPKVRMPKVEDLSLKSAQMTLKSYDLKLGEIKYVPDVFWGVVHEAQMNGREVLEGEFIEKGSVIDLVAGNGYGNTEFRSPTLTGLVLEEATFAIIGSGLKVGKIFYVSKNIAAFIDSDTTIYREIAPGAIQDQDPKPQVIVKIGDPIDLWVYKSDSVNNNSSTILDD